MTKIDLDITIIPQTHFHIGTGYGIAGICDSATLRDKDGFAYISGSTIKGRIKYYYRKLAKVMNLKMCVDESECEQNDKCIICSLFGSPAKDGGVFFGNGVLPDELRENIQKIDNKLFRENIESRIQTNVTINRSRRVAEPQKLFSVETICPKLEYKANISGEFESKQMKDDIPVEVALLVASIKSVEAFGGRKSRGLGRCVFSLDKIKIDSSDKEPIELIKSLQGVNQ